jgi:hypothetical protein
MKVRYLKNSYLVSCESLPRGEVNKNCKLMLQFTDPFAWVIYTGTNFCDVDYIR